MNIGLVFTSVRQQLAACYCALLCFASTLTNVNFDADRFPPMIRQAIDYRSQLKTAYENECKRRNITPRVFTQSEATWNPDPDVWVGTTEKLQAEGHCKLAHICFVEDCMYECYSVIAFYHRRDLTLILLFNTLDIVLVCCWSEIQIKPFLVFQLLATFFTEGINIACVMVF